jgi:hypothetical protein
MRARPLRTRQRRSRLLLPCPTFRLRQHAHRSQHPLPLTRLPDNRRRSHALVVRGTATDRGLQLTDRSPCPAGSCRTERAAQPQRDCGPQLARRACRYSSGGSTSHESRPLWRTGRMRPSSDAPARLPVSFVGWPASRMPRWPDPSASRESQGRRSRSLCMF